MAQKWQENVLIDHAQRPTVQSPFDIVRTFTNDNSPMSKRFKPYYMINSSYLVASDPNSMRDTGPMRNAVYNMK